MTANTRQAIERQVRRVRRRLFLQHVVAGLALAAAGGLVVTTAWLLLAPFVGPTAPDWTWKAVLGGSTGLLACAAIVRALFRRPDASRSALWLDSAFDLRERVTTALALSDTEAASPAGVALLADTLGRVESIRVADRFPVRLPRSAWLAPTAGMALALVALFYDPVMPSPQVVGQDQPKPVAKEAKDEIEKKLQALAKPKREPVVDLNRPKSEDLKRIEAKLEEVARQPRDNSQQLRERIKDLTPLEDEIKKLERERGEKSRMLQMQLQSKDAILPNEAANDGPAKDLMKSLSEGDMSKSKDELEKLAKKLANNELNEQEKQQLAQQMNQMQKKLNDLAQQKQKEEFLKKLGQDGKLDPEALERELAELKKDTEKLKDLKKLADSMNQCQQCMKSGDASGAQKAMREAAEQLKSMARDDAELNELRQAMQDLQEAKDLMARSCDSGDNGGDKLNRPNEGGGDNPGQSLQNDSPFNSDLSQGGGQGMGRRPDGTQGKTRPYDARQDAKLNPKGQKQFQGFVPGEAFRKKAGVDLAEDIRQAAQDAPEAIENQRIPKTARDMARGYFRNLGGQTEGEKTAPKKSEPKKADEAKPK